MPRYYIIGHNAGNHQDIIGSNPSTRKASILRAEINSYNPHKVQGDLMKYTKNIGGIPTGALVMLLRYSLGEGYPERKYKLKKYLPREKVMIFSSQDGRAFMQDIGTSTTESLEGKIIQLLFQNESPVGIKTPDAAK